MYHSSFNKTMFTNVLMYVKNVFIVSCLLSTFCLQTCCLHLNYFTRTQYVSEININPGGSPAGHSLAHCLLRKILIVLLLLLLEDKKRTKVTFTCRTGVRLPHAFPGWPARLQAIIQGPDLLQQQYYLDATLGTSVRSIRGFPLDTALVQFKNTCHSMPAYLLLMAND